MALVMPRGYRVLGVTCAARGPRCISVDHDLLAEAGVPPEVLAFRVEPDVRLCMECMKLYCAECYTLHYCIPNPITH